MHPVLCTIGPLTVYMYGLMLAVGAVTGIGVGIYRAKRRGLDPDHVFGIGLYGVLIGVIGAKIMYVLVHLREMIADPSQIFTGSGFLIYGGMEGKRLDHTVANLQALAFLRTEGARGYLIGREQVATVIEKETAVFGADSSGILSAFCLGKDALGVTILGLQYPLEDGALTADFPLGVSNHFVGKEAEIAVKSGRLLLMWDIKNGLPTIR